ncbi:DUF1330 domain-containing protein [Anderseniella sp. Alg231-50]|uniref:DUF1330 domain-containing protein n=1 Tax=Anderseniella sp. Alg231-50 TaxID=1922226 RepID=UPI000D55733E
MPALMISNITVTDPQKFRDYITRTQAIASGYGAKLLFRGMLNETLAGKHMAGPMVVVAEFPDMETLRRWNSSPEYQDIVALREQSSVQVMNAYETL